MGSFTLDWSQDTTPPDTSITSTSRGQHAVTFSFTGSDNLTPVGELEFAWRLDDGAWSAFSRLTTATLAGLSSGPHRIEAKGRDRAGNEDAAPAALVFSITSGGLRVTILEPARSATVTAGTVLVSGTVEGAEADRR